MRKKYYTSRYLAGCTTNLLFVFKRNLKCIALLILPLVFVLLASSAIAGLLYDYNPVTEVEKTFVLNDGDGVAIVDYDKATVVVDHIFGDKVDLKLFSPEGRVAQDITLDSTKYTQIDINRDKKSDFIIVFKGIENDKVILDFARDEINYKGSGEVVGGAEFTAQGGVTGGAIAEVKPSGDIAKIANKGKGILIIFLILFGLVALVHFYRKMK